VWTTCLVFFSIALLLGYLYAHWLSSKFSPRQQAFIHVTLLTVALLVLGIRCGPSGGGFLSSCVDRLRILATVIGLPYLALARTTPLLTAWYAATFPGQSPYRLFALSNLASLLALASYPLLIEPATMSRQTVWWSTGFLLFAVLCGAIACKAAARARAACRDKRTSPGAVCSCGALVPAGDGAGMMLTAVTSHLSANIAAIPLLWLPPLALYLLSFILAFQGAMSGSATPMLRLALVSVAAMAYVMRDIRAQLPIAVSVPLFLTGFS